MNVKAGLVFLLASVSMPLMANKTPSDVFLVTEQIVLEVQHLRNKLGTTGTPRIPDVQVYKTPLHVYGKSLEVLKKLASINNDAIFTQTIPLRKITLGDVFGQAELILKQVHKIQQQKSIGQAGVDAIYVDGKSPSNVYENLWKVSFMLDFLAKKITPTDVYYHVLEASVQIKDMAQQISVSTTSNLPKTDAEITPDQVLLQGYLNVHQIVEFQKKIGLKPFRVPSYPIGKLTRSDVYDSVSMLIAEIARIKIHLKLQSNAEKPKPTSDKKRSDVLSAMLSIEKNINALVLSQ